MESLPEALSCRKSSTLPLHNPSFSLSTFHSLLLLPSMFHSLLILSILPSSLSIHRDLFLFDDPLELSDDPSEVRPADPFLLDSNESKDDVTSETVQLKHRDNRGISESDDVIDVPSSLDSYSSPLFSSSPDKYSSPDAYSSSLIPSSDQYLPSSLPSSFSQPGPIIESGKFTLISSKLLHGSSLPSLSRPSVIQQAAFGAYPSAQSYLTGTAPSPSPSPSSSYSLSPSLPFTPSTGSNYASPSLEGYRTGLSGAQSIPSTSYPSGGSTQKYVSPPLQGYSNGMQSTAYDGYSTLGSLQNYVTSSQHNDGVYHLNAPIEGRRVVIYKKILRPVRIHTYVTVERLPGGKVVDQWAEGGYSSDLLNGRSSIDAPLFTPTNGFYPEIVNGR